MLEKMSEKLIIIFRDDVLLVQTLLAAAETHVAHFCAGFSVILFTLCLKKAIC